MNEAEVEAMERIRKTLEADMRDHPIPDPATIPVMAPLVDFETGLVRWGVAHPLELGVTIGYTSIASLKMVAAHIIMVEAQAQGGGAKSMPVAKGFGVDRGGRA